MQNSNFYTIGTFGDTVYTLCLVKLLGGGNMYVKLGAIQGGPHHGRYTLKDYEFLEPFLKAQSYINEVAIMENQKIDYDFSKHGQLHINEQWQGNQTECYAMAIGLDIHDPKIKSQLLYEPWLTPVKPIKTPGKFIAVHRAERYHYNGVPSEEWKDFIDQNLSENGFFLGTEKEHFDFENMFKIKIHHQKVEDLLEMTRYIQGCELLIGNQSVHNAIAIGLGKSYWCEIRKDYERTATPHGGYGDNWFPRINGVYF